MNWQFAVLVLFVSLGLSALLTPLARRSGLLLGLLDQPDNGRKHHARAVPRLGGAAIYASFCATVAIIIGLNRGMGLLFRFEPWMLKGLVAGASIVFLSGLIDDVKSLRPGVKLLIQLGAASAAFWSGFRITLVTNPLGEPIALEWASLPVTLFWIIGITNAINLIDGVDGVASGVIVFATATTMLFALSFGNVPVACLLAALLGANLGFLAYNLSPASIFMGDSGSQFCGFTLSLLTLIGSQKSGAAVVIFLPVLILGLPIADTFLSVLRRSRQGVSILRADKDHLHHKLLRRGLSPRQVMYAFYGLCVFLCTAGLVFAASLNLRAAFFHVAGGLAFVLAVRMIDGFRRARRKSMDRIKPHPAATLPCSTPKR